ncbi:MAG: hypothetical protein MJZ66_07975 [Bacteroidales bacterium]|nr:hypothetical protein [Bacteroidales bacterium]
MRRLILLSAWLAASALQCTAQHPYKTDWRVYENDYAKIIYPATSIYAAAKVGNAMRHVYDADTMNMQARPKKMPIIISPTSCTSNGYTTMLPYKMFLYTKPSDYGELSGMYWYQNLMSHEFRHITQYSQFNKGLARLAHCVLGGYGWAGLQYSVPQWYYEGDAVYAETVTSSSGRGRSALFEMPVAAMLVENSKMFPYDKIIQRSYRDYIPNHYPIGYFLTTGAKRKYGNDVFAKVSENQKWYSFWPFAFGQGFKKETGKNLRQNYEEIFGELRDFYKQRIRECGATEHRCFSNQNHKTYTSYRHPKILDDSTLLCIKSSLSKTSQFVKINIATKKETIICNTDASTFDTDGRIAVYATSVPDLRWSLRDYSDLAIVDLESGKTRIVTSKERIFEPSISEDGKRIVATSFSESGECSIVVFESDQTGLGWSPKRKTTVSEKHDKEFYLRQPIFLDSIRIAYIVTFNNNNGIEVIDPRDNSAIEWLGATHNNIQDLSRLESAICFASDKSGISNLYAVTEDGRMDQLTNSKIGAVSPCGNYKMIFFNEYTSKGYKISGVRIGEYQGPSISTKTEYYKPLLDKEASGSLDKPISYDRVDTNNTLESSKKYHQYSDPIRFLGWMPNADESSISVSAKSQNNLETLDISASAIYYVDPGFLRGSASATYKGFWPVISLSASVGEMGENIMFQDIMGWRYYQTCYWREHVISGSVSLPWNLSRRYYNQNVKVSAGLQYYITKGKPYYGLEEMGNGEFAIATASASYSWSKRMAYRDFKNPMAVSAYVSAKKSTSKDLNASMVYSQLSVTVPGILRQNYLTFTGDLIRQPKILNPGKSYLMSNSAFDIRGYKSMRMENLNKIGAEYAFPMGYPDLGIPSIIWITRLRGGISGSIARGNVMGVDLDFASVGAKVIADFGMLRINQEFSVGVSVSKGLKANGLETTEVGLILNLPIN